MPVINPATVKLRVTAPYTTITNLLIDGQNYLFSRAVPYGTFADGKIGWLYVPSGSINLVTPTPAPSGSGAAARNGLMKNPTRLATGNPARGNQPFDGRGPTYDASLLATFPMTLVAGDAVVSVVSTTGLSEKPAALTNTISDGGSQSYVRTWNGFHVLNYIPDADELAPPLVGSNRTRQRPDINAIVAALPVYNASGASNTPSFAMIDFYFNRSALSPPITVTTGVPGRRDMVAIGASWFTGYGEYQADVFSVAVTMLITNLLTTAQKKTIVTRILTNTVQWYFPLAAIPEALPPDGGQNNYIVEQFVFGLRWLGLTSEANALKTSMMGNALTQHGFLNATDISRATTPHSNVGADWPVATFQRALTGVAGNVLTFANSEDTRLAGMRVQRVSDGASALIVATNSSPPSMTLTIDAQPGSPFLNGDVVFFVPAYSLTTTTPHWNGTGFPVNRSLLNFSKNAEYLQGNPRGWILAAVAMGYMHADWRPARDWLWRALPRNWPTASVPFDNFEGDIYDPFFVGAGFQKYQVVKYLFDTYGTAINAIPQVGE